MYPEDTLALGGAAEGGCSKLPLTAVVIVK